jgi:tetratricopeptide (TPR) repeat protein
MKKIMVLLFFSLLQLSLFGQTDMDEQLAQHYYSNGELDKALTYYEKLIEKSPTKFIFFRCYDCYMAVSDFKGAEKLIKKQIAANKNDLDYQVLYGQYYRETNQTDKAQKLYNEMINSLKANSTGILELYNAFKAKNENDLALSTLIQGRKLLKNTYPLNFQFAEIYKTMGETDKMIKEYLDLVDDYPGYSSNIQSVLALQLDFSSENTTAVDLLQNSLIERIQKKPDVQIYNELLIWLYIQKRNFAGALIQVLALDKRLKEDGRRIMDLGKICVENKAYEIARKAFRSIIDLGENKPFYYDAENALLNTRFLEITSSRKYSNDEILATINDYEVTLNRVGKKRSSLPLILELNYILAFYADQAEIAIKNLNEALNLVGLTDTQIAEIKMQLADTHVLGGDIWEASLLYMQVNNNFKQEPIGHEAKFKNARIFYFDGEFDFAQSQLSVLKESTSKLIANDAMNLSILITDNFGLDSNYQAMSWFSTADLFIEQHKYIDAFQLLDSIQSNYPTHSLGDEILMRKSKAMQIQGNWNEAIVYLDELIKNYSTDILADDALFQIADIYENQLNDKEKAAEYYKKILFDYTGSLFAVEARKRFRTLRGDKIDVDEIDFE